MLLRSAATHPLTGHERASATEPLSKRVDFEKARAASVDSRNWKLELQMLAAALLVSTSVVGLLRLDGEGNCRMQRREHDLLEWCWRHSRKIGEFQSATSRKLALSCVVENQRHGDSDSSFHRNQLIKPRWTTTLDAKDEKKRRI